MTAAHLLEEQTPYTEFVGDLVKPGADIKASLTPQGAHLLHMVIGVSGEAGELADAIKKHIIYGKKVDLENVTEELGDLRFYMTGIMIALGITDAQVETANRKKLNERYEKGRYCDKSAVTRADKAK